MNKRKNFIILTGLVLSISLFSASLTAWLFTDYYRRSQMQTFSQIFAKMTEKQPESENLILSVLKEDDYHSPIPPDKDILLIYGYRQTDFLRTGKTPYLFPAAGFAAAGLLFFLTLFLWHRKELSHIQTLTEYLEKVNTGKSSVLFPSGEGEFAKLQDEIYKTVTELSHTKEEALKVKNRFADNLYNIAHQLKTPVTSISLSVQRLQESAGNPEEYNQAQPAAYLEQIFRQLSRLTHLEEALLLLSRIDAGTLSLERKETDVFTILMLAADNLQELSAKADVSFDIPESETAVIDVDLDWTMEAIINLLKNCMEHTPPGKTVHCSFAPNPLYTRICIWDEGDGFVREDIPHLFERFYRGKNAGGGGVGIGLALSKAIIESQNGTITARNLSDKGACFEIRFYSH